LYPMATLLTTIPCDGEYPIGPSTPVTDGNAFLM